MLYRKKDGFQAQKAIVLPPAIIKLFEQSAITSGLYLTDIGYYPKAKFHYRHREHGSAQHILIYCIDGAGVAKVEDQQILIRQGQYLILPKNVKHIYRADEQKPWSIFWVHFKGHLAPQFVALLKKKGDVFSNAVSFDKRRIELFDQIYDTLQTGYSIDNLNYTCILLQHYLATFCYPQIFTPPQREQEDEIDIAIRFMQEHIDKSLNLQTLAAHVYRSVSHFSALFRKKTGYPPLEYFNQIKMQRACQLLEFTDLQIKELSAQLGYQDPFYFSRLFTKMMGLSPLEYRKKKKFN
ncbi:AraC family transcriptional regulator [Niabella insulamsoli]|uniref:AraC family transcriptional regulator n=1 Tax=Niabella insulamsoli TaxID=3144874 RepID=UPI0031FD5B1E